MCIHSPDNWASRPFREKCHAEEDEKDYSVIIVVTTWYKTSTATNLIILILSIRLPSQDYVLYKMH